MRAKRFPLLATLVILIGAPACDNVSFEGFQMELRPPPAPPGVVEGDTATEVVEEAPPEPIELGPLVYLVERGSGADATILPVAELTDEGYRALPDPEEIPEFLERFELGRWEEGRELTLVAHGGRVGTFLATGGTEADRTTCRMRPRGRGVVEISPEVGDQRWFLARPRTEGRPGIEEAARTDPEGAPVAALPPGGVDSDVTAAALNVAQRLIPALGVPWPSSIPGVRRDLQAFGMPGPDGVRRALAASHVFGGQLGVGTPTPNGYGLFFIAVEGEARYDPVVSWYQRAEWGKAFARFIGTHAIRGEAGADAILEVFGESDRWLAILGPDDGEWGLLFQDACGQQPARGAIQSYP